MLSYGFESPLALNSNLAKEIRIFELWILIPHFADAFNVWSKRLITPDFKGFLSHNR